MLGSECKIAGRMIRVTKGVDVGVAGGVRVEVGEGVTVGWGVLVAVAVEMVVSARLICKGG